MPEQNVISNRILLVDDHPAVRQGLKMLLESQNNQVVAEAESYAQTCKILYQQQINLAVLDLSLKDRSGIDLIPALNKQNIRVLVYTMHEDIKTIDRAFDAGAMGYITKREDPIFLSKAIENANSTQPYLSPRIDHIIQNRESVAYVGENTLSVREKQVYVLLSKGFGNAEIGLQLNISSRTVETYIIRIMEKLQQSNRRQLRKYAVSQPFC